MAGAMLLSETCTTETRGHREQSVTRDPDALGVPRGSGLFPKPLKRQDPPHTHPRAPLLLTPMASPWRAGQPFLSPACPTSPRNSPTLLSRCTPALSSTRHTTLHFSPFPIFPRLSKMGGVKTWKQITNCASASLKLSRSDKGYTVCFALSGWF